MKDDSGPGSNPDLYLQYGGRNSQNTREGQSCLAGPLHQEVRMSSERADKSNTESRDRTPSSVGLAAPEPVVRLVPFDPGLPRQARITDPDAQCDCACLIVEGGELPALRAPVSCFLELTPACHNHCPSCGNVFFTPDRSLAWGAPILSAKQWAQILEQLASSALRLKLTGGEPTLHPEFEAIVKRIASLDIPFTVFTNGRWPSPEGLVTLLARIPRFEGLLVSLHGPTAPSHEAFTDTDGSFAETVTNIQRASAAGLSVSLSCVLTQHNWHLIDEILELARRLGASSVVFNRHLGREIVGLTAAPIELRAALEKIGALREAGEPVKLGNCVPECFAHTGQSACLAGAAFLTVDPWGQVRPCNHSAIVCGNLLNQSLTEIWAAPALEQWRQFVPAPCQGCAALATCRGGCRAQALATNTKSDPLMRSPFHKRDRRVTPEVQLFEYARPMGRFVSRAEDFGTLLLAGNRLLPIPHDVYPLLEQLDGQTTLRQIEAWHGQSALDLVGTMYQQGMVELLV
jgi:radical SAM protein with 4Fe4S-binding SPASM domain